DGYAQTAPPAAVARLLALAPGGRAHAVRRTRSNQGQPVAAEVLYVPTGDTEASPTEDDPAQLDAAEASAPATASAHRVLAELRSLTWEGQDRAVELGSARAEDARLLDQLPGAPVLVVTTRYYAAGRTAAVGVATYRADTCRLTFGNAEPLPLAS
ncbi:UTRA domain-containing protein, partial [Streptomyces oceani]